MVRIKVLGPGCRNCQLVAQNTAEALEAIAQQYPGSFDATIQKVTQAEEITKYPILYTPGLVINEKLVCAGRVPSVEEIKGWLEKAEIDQGTAVI
ncbi:MAG: thioredoxin family protein [Chloroflexi bacterium]|nr:thioredoxin family protein [Chloroflexota bacterium]